MNRPIPCPDPLNADVVRLIYQLRRVLETHQTDTVMFVVVMEGQRYVLTFRHDGEARAVVDARLN